MALIPQIPQNRPRVILADVDDTLAPSTQALGAPMVAMLEALVDAGTSLIFVSGGSIPQMKGQVSTRLKRDHVLLGTSGAHAVQMSFAQEKELFVTSFTEKDRADILAALQALIAHYNVKPDTTTDDQLQDRGTQFTLSALGRHAEESRKRAFDPDGSRRRGWVDYMVAQLGADRFSIKAGGTTSLDITPKGVDKGSGLRRLLALLGLSSADCLYFGDRFEEMGNDRPVMDVMDCMLVHSPSQTLVHLQALLALPLRGAL